ncbi:MAG: cytochrome c biogenesis protein [Gemmatimonadetes bacterium]|nr:cytochrome c biogenesis protein [Gemmatimonadota bacterium]
MIHLLALLLYSVAFLLWLRGLARGARGIASSGATWVAVAGLAVHAAALALYAGRFGELPLVGLAPSLSTLAFMTALGVVASLGLREASRVGIVLMPLVLAMEGAAVVMGVRPAPGALDFRGAWLAFHVTLAFAGIVGMAVSGAAGTLYLFQFREIKRKRMGRAFHFLPPLATLDRLGRIAAVAGFILLSLSLVLGWAWTVRFRNSLQGQDPKILWAVFVWSVILAALVVRRVGRGERAAALASSVGFGLILASYLATRAFAGFGAFFL